MAAQTGTTNFGWQNKFSTTLSSGITASDTTIPLNTLPTPTEGFLVIEPDSSTTFEIIYYTSKTGSAVVCPSVGAGRGQDDSTAQSHAVGATVRMDTTAGMFEVLQNMSVVTPGSAGGVAFASGWTQYASTTPNTVAANGNRSYTLTFNGTDLTTTLSPGMRLKTTRTVTAPTQCTSLNGSTQYYSKTSPAGMTFTNNFVVSAYIKLTSYTTQGTIASRFNGTSGWSFRINSSGQINLVGFNAGGSNFKTTQSYQSVPLNKWVHIVSQLDMTSSTNSPTVNYTMIDGVDVPASQVSSGTNPTALIQAGNLEIGSENGGTNPFPGKIAQVAIYSAKVTEATILASMNQTLAGTETSLISAYSFNNTINDLNANANNLTANGSAVATTLDTPFTQTQNLTGITTGTTNYGIITSASFSTNTTLVVQVPEGDTLPTSGGVSALSYSTQSVPFGFPKQKGKWKVNWLAIAQQLTTVNNTKLNLTGAQISLPIGSWRFGYRGTILCTNAGTTFLNAKIALSTSTNAFSADLIETKSITPNVSSNTSESDGSVFGQCDYDLAAQTTVYLVADTTANTQNNGVYYGSPMTQIEAECAYI